MLDENPRALRMAMLTSDEHPDDLGRAACLELPRVSHTQSEVIDPPRRENSAKTWPDSSYLMVLLCKIMVPLGRNDDTIV